MPYLKKMQKWEVKVAIIQCLVFACSYAGNLESHFQNLALQHVPENLRSFDPAKMSVRPNLDSYVFFKVKQETPGVLMEDDTGEGR